MNPTHCESISVTWANLSKCSLSYHCLRCVITIEFVSSHCIRCVITIEFVDMVLIIFTIFRIFISSPFFKLTSLVIVFSKVSIYFLKLEVGHLETTQEKIYLDAPSKHNPSDLFNRMIHLNSYRTLKIVEVLSAFKIA